MDTQAVGKPEAQEPTLEGLANRVRSLEHTIDNILLRLA